MNSDFVHFCDDGTVIKIIFWDLSTFITTFFLETFSTFFAFEIGAVDARQMAP